MNRHRWAIYSQRFECNKAEVKKLAGVFSERTLFISSSAVYPSAVHWVWRSLLSVILFTFGVSLATILLISTCMVRSSQSGRGCCLSASACGHGDRKAKGKGGIISPFYSEQPDSVSQKIILQTIWRTKQTCTTQSQKTSHQLYKLFQAFQERSYERGRDVWAHENHKHDMFEGRPQKINIRIILEWNKNDKYREDKLIKQIIVSQLELTNGEGTPHVKDTNANHSLQDKWSPIECQKHGDCHYLQSWGCKASSCSG